MTPLDQTQFGENGNCMSATLASILDTAIETIPNFYDGGGSDNDYWARFRAFLQEQGYGFVWISAAGTAEWLMKTYPQAYFLAGGLTSRGYGHSVIYQGGKLVHDPHPSREGIKEVQELEVLFPLDPGLMGRLLRRLQQYEPDARLDSI